MRSSPGVTVNADGWASTQLEPGVTVHLRVGLAEPVGVVVTDILISASDITGEVLAAVQPGRILAAIRKAGGVDFTLGDEERQVSPGTIAALRADDSGTTLGELRKRATKKFTVPKRERLARPQPGAEGALLDLFYARVAA